MRSDYRTQLAAAVAKFLADIRRLGQAMIDRERERLLLPLDSSRPRSAVDTKARPARARAAVPERPAARKPRDPLSVPRRQAPNEARRQAAPTTSSRSVVPKPARPQSASAEASRRGPGIRRTPAARTPDAEVTVAHSSAPAIATPALATLAVTEASTSLAAPVAEDGHRTEQAPRTHAHEARRFRGTVKWFSDAKGYGFIRGDDGRDAFVHYSAISQAGLRTLLQGQIVEYEVQMSAKGLQAASVTDPGSG